jgi:hypothetical protein
LRDDLLVFLVAEAEAAAKGVERVRGMWEVCTRFFFFCCVWYDI